MFNLNGIKEGTVLDDLFESREEDVCALVDGDKQKIKRLTRNNDSYDKLIEKIEDLSSNYEKLEEIKDSLDSYIDKINIIGAYENEKFYKIRICRCNKSNFRL